MTRLAVLASGTGSNFEAICEAFEKTPYYPVLLICDRKDAPVLHKAERRGVESLHFPLPAQEREEAAGRLSRLLREREIELIVLAGFMKVLPPVFVKDWKDKILNIHPSILPRYPGTEAIRRAWDAGEEWFGITIHLVDEGVDTGPILFQNMFHRLPEDTLESLENKVHRLEHLYYPEIILKFAQGWRRTK